MLSENQRRHRAKLGGLATAARHDPRDVTLAAREAFLRSFLDKVDPERVLSAHERSRRAEAARREHMTRLAWLSARARSRGIRRDNVDRGE